MSLHQMKMKIDKGNSILYVSPSAAPHVERIFNSANGNAVYTNTPKPVTYTLTLPVLREGDTGETVKALQYLLIANGISLVKYGADGDYGAETVAGVTAYQKKVGLSADGVAGPDTMGKLLGLR